MLDARSTAGLCRNDVRLYPNIWLFSILIPQILKHCDCSFIHGCCCYSVRALRTASQQHDVMPLYNSSFSSRCRCHASDVTFLTALLVIVDIGHHFISVLSSTHSFFRTLAPRDLKSTQNLAGVLSGWIGMMIKVGAWGSLQGLTGLAPTREFTLRSHWTTHYCRTISFIYSTTVLHGITIETSLIFQQLRRLLT
jgi:hypothetical protein